MADSETITHVPPCDLDPALQAIAAEQAAAQAHVAALAALDQAGADAAWLAYQAGDLEEAEAAAGAALSEAERRVLTTRPASIQGAAALLSFLRRYLADDAEMPPSARRIAAALGHAETCLQGCLGGPPAMA